MHTSSLLFEPFSLGSLDLNNRVVMAPMTRSFSPGNVPNEQNVEYYRTRAANQVGLIITEGTCINHQASCGEPDVPFFYGEQALAGWKKIVDAVHAEGGKIIPQLWHVGILRPKGAQPDPEVPAYGPSGIVSPGKERGETMSQQDIDEVIAAYAQAAKDAQTLGFDGVEIHGAHGYLVDQFFGKALTSVQIAMVARLRNALNLRLKLCRPSRLLPAPTFPWCCVGRNGSYRITAPSWLTTQGNWKNS